MSESIPADILKHATKAIVGLFPGGSVLAEIFDFIIGRHDDSAAEFIQLSLGHAYVMAEARGITAADLQTNEVLHRTLYAATRAALATGSMEKKRKLRNAVVNAAIRPEAWADDEARMHRLLDICDDDHLAFLARLSTAPDNPSLATSVPPIYIRAFVTMATPRDDINIAHDLDIRAHATFSLLFSEGLITRGGLPPLPTIPAPGSTVRNRPTWSHELDAELSRYVGRGGSPSSDCRLTRLGRRFVEFVSTTSPDPGCEGPSAESTV